MVREIDSKRSNNTIKFLCSYGGKILPRSGDGKLRYVGGLTRVLSVDRSISYTELMVKFGEFSGYSVNLRCQLPNGDLETLISIKSDEDLANLIEVYNQASASSKIRAILSPPRCLKQISPPPSSPSSIDLSTPKSIDILVKDHLRRRSSLPPLRFIRDSAKACYRHCHVHGSPSGGRFTLTEVKIRKYKLDAYRNQSIVFVTRVLTQEQELIKDGIRFWLWVQAKKFWKERFTLATKFPSGFKWAKKFLINMVTKKKKMVPKKGQKQERAVGKVCSF